MQTILGANGQIAVELARELDRRRSGPLRLVSRNPHAVNAGDELRKADLLDARQTAEAVAGSDIVYFTAGLPANTEQWERQFPTMLRNALDAAHAAGAKFAYFDNTYMYPQDDRIQTEDTPFAPVGPKGRVRAAMATMVLDELAAGDIPVLIARAPEFYGPGRTKSFTNAFIFERLTRGRTPLAPVRADRLRTLIWTPDASRALATLGGTPDAFGQTWHLPVDENRLTYRQIARATNAAFDRPDRLRVLPEWVLRTAGLVSPEAREIEELLPRYRHDNRFDSTKFAERFPDFAVTPYERGIEIIRDEARARADSTR